MFVAGYDDAEAAYRNVRCTSLKVIYGFIHF